MKILQVNCHYNYGSTGKIMKDVDTYLKENGIVSIQCYGRGKNTNDPGVYRIANEAICKVRKLIDTFVGRPLWWGKASTKKLIQIVKDEQPDVVHLHCCNAYMMNLYKFISYLKNAGINTMITIHAEFMYTGGCAYALDCDQWREENGCANCREVRRASRSVLFNHVHQNWKDMQAAVTGFEKDRLLLASVSPWLEERAKNSTIFKEYSHTVVLNGINTNVFCRRSQREQDSVRQKYGLDSRKIVLHVTSAYDADIKGGKYVDEIAGKLLEDGKSEYQVVVVGPHNHKPKHENIVFLGIIRNQEDLAALYSLAEVTLLTSKKETFSMICAETICCGTPLVGFKAGAPETIAMPEYSRFCDHGDTDALYANLLSYLSEFDCDRDMVAAKGRKKYASETMAGNYLKLYEEMTK